MPADRDFEKRLGDRARRQASPAKPALDDDRMLDEEKILAGRDDVNLPALLTKDVLGG